jgi:hypothetical protein
MVNKSILKHKNDIKNIAKHVCYCCVLRTKFVLHQNHISKDLDVLEIKKLTNHVLKCKSC